MKAIVYDEFGGPEVLRLAELPDPLLNADGVLVQVKAAAVNPADLTIRTGALATMMETYFPVVPGWDIAGVVIAAGSAAPEFAPGDEVIGYIRAEALNRHGAYAELVAADVRTLAWKPAGLNWAEAAALPLAGLAAYQAVISTLKVSADDILLIHGAAGGVGSLAVQLGVAAGARVIGTASAADRGYVRSLGAEPLRYGDGLVVPEGVTAVLDTVGGQVGAPGARVATIAGSNIPGAAHVSVRLDDLNLKRLVELDLSVRVARTYPLHEAATAHRAHAAGNNHGRLVLTID